MSGEELYAALLHLYPSPFRLEYREAMIEAFRAARRDMSPGRFWLMMAADLCRSVPLEHWRAVEPDARRVARCALAGVVGTALLAGSITVVVGAAAGSARPIREQLSIAGLQTGWLTAGTTMPGGSKVVPFVTVMLENVGPEPIDRLRLTAVFRRVDDNTSWGEAYLPSVGSSGFEPGSSTGLLPLQSALGYTGEASPQRLLQHKDFVDVRVTLLAKRGPAQWQRLGEWPVRRALVEPR